MSDIYLQITYMSDIYLQITYMSDIPDMSYINLKWVTCIYLVWEWQKSEMWVTYSWNEWHIPDTSDTYLKWVTCIYLVWAT